MNQTTYIACWRDKSGNLCLDIPQLLKAAGIPDTEENRDLAVSIALRVARKQWPEVPTVVVLGRAGHR